MGFQVSVEDAVIVAESDALKKLVHKRFDGDIIELTSRIARVHVFLKVLVHVFEDEHEFVFGVDDIVQRDYVFVFELFHEGNFADGSAGGAFFTVEVDFFQGDEFARLPVAAFEDLGVCGVRVVE